MADVESKLRRDITPMPDADPLLDSAASEASAVISYLASFLMTAVATVVAVGVDSGVTIPNLSLIFVVPVIIAGVAFGLGPSVCSALLGALAYNFFLTEPRYSFVVNAPADIWAIGLLFLVGLIVSGVAFTSRRRANDAALLRRQATVLQGYSRNVVVADNAKTIVSITSQALAALFAVPVVVMLVADGEVVYVNRVGDVEPKDADFEAARSSLTMGTVARAGIYPALASRFDFWPVVTAAGQCAVIGLGFDPDDRPSAPDVRLALLCGVNGKCLGHRKNGAHDPMRTCVVRDLEAGKIGKANSEQGITVTTVAGHRWRTRAVVRRFLRSRAPCRP